MPNTKIRNAIRQVLHQAFADSLATEGLDVQINDWVDRDNAFGLLSTASV